MRSDIPASVLLASLHLWALSTSLPLVAPQQQEKLPLVPRYSVVPINGGAGSPGGSGSGTGSNRSSDDSVRTVVKTVVATLPPKISVATVDSPTVTRHVTDTVTSISTVNINPAPTTKTETSIIYVTPTPSSKAPAASLSETVIPPPSRSVSISVPTQNTGPAQASSLSIYPVEATLPSTTSISLLTAYSSTKTYDDGMWHTTYPSWNGTFARRAANV